MRLIDADAYEYPGDLINEPTIDAAPVVHGRWEVFQPGKHMILTSEEYLFRCTCCDAKYSDVEGFRFCPHCGAMMDG